MRRSRGALGTIAVAVTSMAVGYFLASPARAADASSGRDLVVRSDQRTKSRTEKTLYRMELLDADGDVTQARRLEVYFKRDGSVERTLQKFLSPPVIEGTGLLIEDTGAEVNDIWLYLPATRRLRRIAGVEKSNWYMGTELTYEDFEDYQIPYYDFALAGDEACPSGGRCTLVEATPATPSGRATSGYSKKVYWLETESLYPVRVDFYAEDGHRAKELVSAGLEEVNGYWRPRTIVMRNLDTGRATRLTVEERRVDAPLDDYHVTKRYLRSD